MNKIITNVGAIVVSFFLIMIPFICAVSFEEGWPGFVKFVLLLSLMVEYVLLVSKILNDVEKEVSE